MLPGNGESVQRALRRRLADADVTVTTGDRITEVTADELRFDEGDPLECDVFVWTGGVTGCEPLASLAVDREKYSDRVLADVTFRTSDERVFAVGDAAVIEGADGDDPPPPTAQAAWQAADVAAGNLLRAMDGRSLERWRYEDEGTLVSVGERAVAHDVMYVGRHVRLPAGGLSEEVRRRPVDRRHERLAHRPRCLGRAVARPTVVGSVQVDRQAGVPAVDAGLALSLSIRARTDAARLAVSAAAV